ncbi:MAG: hypothetical protein U0326_02605 [Polyangiales bacterium]
MAAHGKRVVRAVGGAAADARREGAERSTAAATEADWQAWLDERAAAAIAAQDDAEMLARRWGPEPEFMLAAGGGHAC